MAVVSYRLKRSNNLVDGLFKRNSPLMKLLRESGLSQINDRFRLSGDPGKPWKALKDGTVLQKQKKGKTSLILVNDSILRNSFTGIIEDYKITWQTPVPYANAHQNGDHSSQKVPAHIRNIPAHKRKTKSGKLVKVKAHRQKVKAYTRKNNLAARPMIRFTKDNIEEFNETIIDFLGG